METVLLRDGSVREAEKRRNKARQPDRFGTEQSRAPGRVKNDEADLILTGEREQQEKSGGKAKHGLFSTLVITLAIFAVFAFTIYRYQQVFVAESELNALKSQISVIEEENERLKTQIAVSEDIEMIRERASSELDMYFPDDAQLASVELMPAPAPEIVSETATEDSGSDALDILAVIKSIFS